MIRRFNRFELKYLVHTRERDAIIEDMAGYTLPDPHGDQGTYRVTSLYYDSHDLTAYWSKLDGLKYRRKLRLRVYGSERFGDQSFASAEIKQRINRTVQKRRLPLSLAEAYALCEGQGLSREVDAADAQVASEIDFMVQSQQLQPACVISYLRRAYMGDSYNAHLRITFDEDLTGSSPEHGVNGGALTRHIAPLGWSVMEVKVDETVPIWVCRMLARHQCHLRRISKYCAGISALYGPDTGSRGLPWMSC